MAGAIHLAERTGVVRAASRIWRAAGSSPISQTRELSADPSSS